MANINVTIEIEVDDVAVDELKSSLIHHIEKVLDLGSWPEIESVTVKSVKQQRVY